MAQRGADDQTRRVDFQSRGLNRVVQVLSIVLLGVGPPLLVTVTLPAERGPAGKEFVPSR